MYLPPDSKIHTLDGPLLYCTYNALEYGGNDELPYLGYGKHEHLHHVPLDPLLFGMPAPCCEKTQAVLWRGLYGEEMRLPVNSQHQLASYMSEPSQKQMTSANSLIATSQETLRQNHPANHLFLVFF